MVQEASIDSADDSAANSTLTASQRTALATFRAVTSIASDADALPHLTATNWNLERAVDHFLEPAASSPSTPNDNGAPAPPPPTTTAVANPNPRPFPRWLLALTSPLRFVWSLFSGLTSALIRLFGTGPNRAIEAAPGATPSARFASFFDARYGTSHPPFYLGPYFSALAAAQSNLQFLLVYVHSESHRLTPRFSREVLCAPSLVTAAEPMVFWAASVSQRDGAAVQRALRAPALPFLAIVAPPSSRVSPDADLALANYGTVLAVRAGFPALNGGGDGAAAWVDRVLARHGGILVAARQQRDERESARLLREQQDMEYAAALEEDREKERKAQEEQDRVEGERERLRGLEVRRERKREALGEEPEKGPGVASVVMRLPDGSRVGRRFEKANAMEVVFDWAEVNRVDIEKASLVTTYPRRSLRYPEDADMTVEQAGLFPSAMLLLEERSDE
ncbi:unnamed protein product [Chondrus crispus]|uniref:UBX domain-containing protein n=1 Tax=Chondrus crispus TaxID=2769 RepID=R7QB66_CHOCR|nr:unnamed protein product [Chondrus crispus]CDF35762.1 unnamed protein product [Chondrus crispus]|eukprot:XP_005715581.1 unnamed protein product [Chondrus crispus]